MDYHVNFDSSASSGVSVNQGEYTLTSLDAVTLRKVGGTVKSTVSQSAR